MYNIEGLKSSASCGIVLLYDTVKKYHTDHTEDTFNSLPMILVSWDNHSCVCRRQCNEIYFRELFLAAHFSQKFEKPSDKVPTVHFFLCYDSTFHNLPSKIVLYKIYVIM
jgi:hypothetical protein